MRRSFAEPVSKRLMSLALCVLLTVPVGAPLAFAETQAASSRITIPIAGGDRYETAVAASVEAYPDGADTVIIATGRNWPDALGGSALAGALEAPILLVPRTSVPDVVLTEISRLNAEKAIIVGGEVAVARSVFTALQSAGLTVERIDGDDRYDTANHVATRVIELLGDDYDGTAFVATGGNFPDALAAAPLAAAKGWPLYLARTNSLRANTMAAMADVENALILGGEMVVSAAVKTQLEGILAGDVTRLGGANRYETAVEVATFAVTEAGHAWNRVGITTGEDFPDALAGGVLQGTVGSVMLLTRPTSLQSETRVALRENGDAISTVTYFGGRSAVSRAVRDAVAGVRIVTFADPNLGRAVRGKLNKGTGDITAADMERLRSLYAPSRSISDLTGLEYACNLTQLNLFNNSVSDISALAGLKKLTVLELSYNDISDISALAGLKNLTILQLSGRDISDISALAGLTNLTTLYLASIGNSDISALAGLTNLTILYLGLSDISDISALAGLTNLTTLNLAANDISDISALAGLTNLTALILPANSISDISALAGLTNLGWLELCANEISDISGLAGLTNLTHLALWTNGISDISPLVANTGLGHRTAVDLRNNNLDLTPSSQAMNDIATLQARGVDVAY